MARFRFRLQTLLRQREIAEQTHRRAVADLTGDRRGEAPALDQGPEAPHLLEVALLLPRAPELTELHAH